MKKIFSAFLFILMTVITVGQEKQLKNQKYMDNNNTISKDEFTETDLKFLAHCLELAEEALNAGDQPFGSILVDENDEVIAEARNRINEKHVLAHPEIDLAYWAMENLTLEERRTTTMYTTGEHCPMCAAAHGWGQIGKLSYLSSAKQLGKWLAEIGVEEAPIEFIPASEILKNVVIKGPAKGKLVEEIKQLHFRYYENKE